MASLHKKETRTRRVKVLLKDARNQETKAGRTIIPAQPFSLDLLRELRADMTPASHPQRKQRSFLDSDERRAMVNLSATTVTCVCPYNTRLIAPYAPLVRSETTTLPFPRLRQYQPQFPLNFASTRLRERTGRSCLACSFSS